MIRRGAVIVLCAFLSGCAFYHPMPLPESPDYTTALPPSLSPGPLDMEDVAKAAVLRSPDLIASRRKADIAEAQSFAAGLLPDPQLTANVDHPSAAGFSNGYALGLSEDLQALLLQPAKQATAKAAADQAKLSALWDEWQTIEKACTLYVQKVTADAKVAGLDRSVNVLSTQAERSSKALETHDITLDQAGADQAAALDAASQRDTAARDALTADAGLKALIDIHPTMSLQLAGLGEPTTFTKEQLTAALQTIRKTRPDLLALQAGYKSQEEAVWQAILSQFPTISLGITRAADTSNVHTTGLGLTINLPIFNGARGSIRVQSATRAELYAEYQARLDQTTADAWRLWEEMQILQEHIGELKSKLPGFRKMAEAGHAAYANRDLSPATYVVMQTSLIARESELLDLGAALWTDNIALHTLLGAPYVSDVKAGTK